MNFLKNTAVLCAVTCSFLGTAFAQEELKVVCEPSYAPFEFMDPDTSELTGFDVDIIKAIAEVQGFKTDISTMPFDAQIPAIVTNQADVAISAFTITEERAKTINFSSPYYDAGQSALIAASKKDEIKSLKDIEGRVICTQIGTSGAILAQEIKDATVNQYNTIADAFIELDKGGCDVNINDKPVLEYYLATSHDELVYLMPETFTTEQYGIVTSKSRPELGKMIEEGLQKIRKNGTYDKIYAKWFGAAK